MNGFFFVFSSIRCYPLWLMVEAMYSLCSVHGECEIEFKPCIRRAKSYNSMFVKINYSLLFESSVNVFGCTKSVGVVVVDWQSSCSLACCSANRSCILFDLRISSLTSNWREDLIYGWNQLFCRFTWMIEVAAKRENSKRSCRMNVFR